MTLNGELVGVLCEDNNIWTFIYDPDWAASPTGFDLSPALSRSQLRHTDGSTVRSVQWYFDNLLPEEELRSFLANENKCDGSDAFSLLAYFGAESAGSLVLLPPGQHELPGGQTRALPDEILYQRIKDLPHATLTKNAPKRMSLAGAQHKLLVVYTDGKLDEPVGGTPSTHILKPNHQSAYYPASVMNEYFTMRLAAKLGLNVPLVYRHYTPEPVYIIQRFDRYTDTSGQTQRRHIIDTCQLLDKDRLFKYRDATIATLKTVISRCRNKVAATSRLYQWLVFNILIANADNHLKNLSFTVSEHGIDLSPFYDILSTGVYQTRAIANERATWDKVDMVIALGDVKSFSDVTRAVVLQAGADLGLSPAACVRELDRQIAKLPGVVEQIEGEIMKENALLKPAVAKFLASEIRLIGIIKHIIVPEMIKKISVNNLAKSSAA